MSDWQRMAVTIPALIAGSLAAGVILGWVLVGPPPAVVPVVPEGCTSSVSTIPAREGRPHQSVTVIVCPSDMGLMGR